MKTRLLALLFALVAGAALAGAEDAKPVGKTEPKEQPKAFDRGDEKAEKMLKRAYTRIASAEAKGLERLVAEAKVSFDMSKSAMPLKVPPCDGKLMWRAGNIPLLDLDDPPGGLAVSTYAESAFQPYTIFVFGMPSWETFFKQASFKFTDAPADLPKEAANDKFILVTFLGEDATHTYQVRDITLVSVTLSLVIADNPATAKLTLTYEDKGKELRIIQIDTDADVTMKLPMPEGEDEGGEGENKDQPRKTNVQQTIKLTEYATAGRTEICSRLEAGLSIDFGGGRKLEFPATLELKNVKANKDVTDADLKPMVELEEARARARAKKAAEKAGGKSGDKPAEKDAAKPKPPEEEET